MKESKEEVAEYKMSKAVEKALNSYTPEVHKISQRALPKLLKDPNYGLGMAAARGDFIEIDGERAILVPVDSRGPNAFISSMMLHHDPKDPSVQRAVMECYNRLNRMFEWGTYQPYETPKEEYCDPKELLEDHDPNYDPYANQEPIDFSEISEEDIQHISPRNGSKPPESEE